MKINIIWQTIFILAKLHSSKGEPASPKPTCGPRTNTNDDLFQLEFPGKVGDNSRGKCLIEDVGIWWTSGYLRIPKDYMCDFNPEVQITVSNQILCHIGLKDTDCIGPAPPYSHCWCYDRKKEYDFTVYFLSVQQKVKYADRKKTVKASYTGKQVDKSGNEKEIEIGHITRFIRKTAIATYKINMQNEKLLQEAQTVTVTSEVKVTFCVHNLDTHTKTIDGSLDGTTEEGDCISKKYTPPAKPVFRYQESAPCQRTANFTLQINAPVEDCTADYCKHGGVCLIVLGYPSCACPVGYEGKKCETVPAPGEACTADYCKHGGVCLIVLGHPSCACPWGFDGKHCETGEIRFAASADGKLQPPALLMSVALGLCRLIHYM